MLVDRCGGFEAFETDRSWVMFRTKAPDSRSTMNEGYDVALVFKRLSRRGMLRHADALLV